MTAEVQHILHTIDSLPDPDKRALVTEILRRSLALDQPSLTDEALTEAADALLQELDRSEG
jgi:hypothetical protein